MFIPLFIAIMLGLVSPSANTTSHDNGTVITTNSDTGDNGDDDGTGGPVSPPTTGENGQLPPPKP